MINESKKIIALKIISVIINISMLILSCFVLIEYPKIVILISFILFGAMGVIIPSVDVRKHETFFKSLIVLLFLLSILLVSYTIMEKSGFLEKVQDVDVVLSFIRSTKQLGVIVFILFVIAQLIFLPLPAAVPAIIGIALYGSLFSFIYMSIGTIIGSIISFMLGKIFGKKLVSWMIGKEKTEKYADLIDKKGRFVFVFMMIFPFFPDDILCMVAGITNMSYRFFICVICLTRTIMLAFICFFMDGSIIPFSGWGIPVWIGLFSLSVAIFIIFTKFKSRLTQKTEQKGIHK